MIIKRVKAKKIKNSRGEETIKVFVKSDTGKGEASAPSGASKGKHAVKDFVGSVDDSIKFLKNCNELVGLEINSFDDLDKVEKIVDKEKYGSNTVIALEYAILKALGSIWKLLNPKVRKISRPLSNIIGGGAHFKGKGTDIQEFLVYPVGAMKISEAVKANSLIHSKVSKKLREVCSDFSGEVTDEGAWAPNLNNYGALDLLSEIAKEVSREVGFNIRIGLDIAASSLWDGKKYVYKNFSKDENEKSLDKKGQIKFVSELIEKYDLLYVEDPLHEDDFSGFGTLTKKFGKKCMIVGDDLVVTSLERLKKAGKSINGVIVKPNQIGSLIETKKFVDYAKEKKMYLIVSHRSGETIDASISHLAIGWEISMIKCGIYGSERISKLDELRNIAREIRSEK
jgi:enolase